MISGNGNANMVAKYISYVRRRREPCGRQRIIDSLMKVMGELSHSTFEICRVLRQKVCCTKLHQTVLKVSAANKDPACNPLTYMVPTSTKKSTRSEGCVKLKRVIHFAGSCKTLEA